jgi:Tol biopolymer transport system component
MAPYRSSVRSLLLLLGTAGLACQTDSPVEQSLGTLEITTWTNGLPLDPDGYTVQVAGGPARPIGIAAALLEQDAPGGYSVRLDGVALNCLLTGENPRTATVVTSDTTRINFTVNCAPLSGSVVVLSSTTGSFPDPDGYRTTIDQTAERTIPANGVASVSPLAPGEHAVTLDRVAANCQVQGNATATAHISAGQTDTVTFSIACPTPPPIAFVSSGEIHLANPDGSGLKKVTPGEVNLREPGWSPDGTRIAFSNYVNLEPSEYYELWVMNSDGSGRTRLMSSATKLYDYHWSPDGSRIAFAKQALEVIPAGLPDGSCSGLCYVSQVWVMAADGSNPKLLALGAGISWSPDGGRIAFQNVQLYVMDVEGSGLARITNFPNGASGAAWSPDGGRIAFLADPAGVPPQGTPLSHDIFLINPDGTDLVNLTRGRGDHDIPRWSPDGTRIAFGGPAGVDPLSGEIGVINRDGSGETNLTRSPAFDFDPHWSADGRQILFSSTPEYLSGSNEAYVMSSDGQNVTNVSNGPAADLDWSPRR